MTIFPVEAAESKEIERITNRRGQLRPPMACLYVSVDIDGADRPSPGANSPKPGGLTTLEIIRGVRNRGACRLPWLRPRRGFAGVRLGQRDHFHPHREAPGGGSVQS
jgi:hypothetical protein